MPNPTNTDSGISIASETPDIEGLKTELGTAISDAFFYYERCAVAFDTRFCFWEGQTPDGRKHTTAARKAFPWEDASDARIRTVDMIIKEKAALLKKAFARMSIQAIPTKAADSGWGAKVTALLRYYLYTCMADETDAEVELLANYLLTYGSAVLAVDWIQQLAFEMTTVTLDNLRDLALQRGGPRLLADMGRMLFDPMMEEQVVQWATQLSPMMTKGEARSVVKDLKEMATCTFPKPYLAASRPGVCALATFQDIYFPIATDRVQKARIIARREFFTETELREKAESREQWDKDFVEEAIQQKGESWNQNWFMVNLMERQRQIGGVWGNYVEETRDLVEVWHFYYRASKKGYPAVYHTVLHPRVKDYHGLHEIIGYQHGQYPFVEFMMERHSRSILSSRGIPEISDTHQFEIKTQRDSRVDRSSMTTSPPMLENTRRAKLKTAFGPGSKIPVTKEGDLVPLLFGAPDPTSVEVENATKMDLNEFHGRRGPGIDPQIADEKNQDLADTWLKRWKVAATQIVQLAQQFTNPEVAMRIVGPMNKPIQMSREDIQGEFDLMIAFDVRFANMDFIFKMMEGFEKYVFPLDSNARINRDVVLEWAFRGIDPTLADLAIQDGPTADQSEIEDEMKQIALAWSGQEPPMKMQGQNFPLRLQVIQNAAAKNPFIQQHVLPMLQMPLDKIPTDNPVGVFAKIMKARVAFLTQQVEQQKNKAIGVYGTGPALGGGGGGQPQPPGMGGGMPPGMSSGMGPGMQLGAFGGG